MYLDKHYYITFCKYFVDANIGKAALRYQAIFLPLTFTTHTQARMHVRAHTHTLAQTQRNCEPDWALKIPKKLLNLSHCLVHFTSDARFKDAKKCLKSSRYMLL